MPSTVWGAPTGEANEYVLDNVPFFAPFATIGDTVRVRVMEGNLWFQCVAKRSSHSLVRLVFFDKGGHTHHRVSELSLIHISEPTRPY